MNTRTPHPDPHKSIDISVIKIDLQIDGPVRQGEYMEEVGSSKTFNTAVIQMILPVLSSKTLLHVLL